MSHTRYNNEGKAIAFSDGDWGQLQFILPANKVEDHVEDHVLASVPIEDVLALAAQYIEEEHQRAVDNGEREDSDLDGAQLLDSLMAVKKQKQDNYGERVPLEKVQITYQVAAEDGSVWNMAGKLLNVPGTNQMAVVQLTHPNLRKLPKDVG